MTKSVNYYNFECPCNSKKIFFSIETNDNIINKKKKGKIMKKCLIFITFTLLFIGIFNLPVIEETGIFESSIALAQSHSGVMHGESKNYALRTGLTLLGFVVLWFIFYNMVYPFLLNYYLPHYSQNLFWSMLLLYSLAWLSIATYVIIGIGVNYWWSKWVFVFFGALWLIWFLVILLGKQTSAG